MNLFNRYANRNKRFIHELEWSDFSCSRVDNSLIQMIRLERVSSELNSHLVSAREQILGLIIVTENHIKVKTVSCLWAKSDVKSDIFKPSEMLECRQINSCVVKKLKH